MRDRGTLNTAPSKALGELLDLGHRIHTAVAFDVVETLEHHATAVAQPRLR